MTRKSTKTCRAILLGVVLSVLLFSSGIAQQLKLGYVDVVRLKKEYKEYVAAEAKFEKMMAVWQGKADSMQNEMKDIADKLEKPSPLLTDQGKNELREKLLVKQNEYQLYVNQVMGQEGEAAQKEVELSKPLIDKINTVIKLVALKGSYSFVLDSTSMPVKATISQIRFWQSSTSD
jgi:Skp family chaperone for outer membrane proteins